MGWVVRHSRMAGSRSQACCSFQFIPCCWCVLGLLAAACLGWVVESSRDQGPWPPWLGGCEAADPEAQPPSLPPLGHSRIPLSPSYSSYSYSSSTIPCIGCRSWPLPPWWWRACYPRLASPTRRHSPCTPCSRPWPGAQLPHRTAPSAATLRPAAETASWRLRWCGNQAWTSYRTGSCMPGPASGRLPARPPAGPSAGCRACWSSEGTPRSPASASRPRSRRPTAPCTSTATSRWVLD